MPLKHHTETAYLLFLGIVICVAGLIASLLPPLPSSLVAWIFLLIITGLYPVVLAGTFRSNRADYEFRLLHWFPMWIFLIWGLIDLAAPHVQFLHILKLGCFYLWSLPVVALGLFFIMLFASHVIRRSRSRITFIALFLILFTAGAITAEAQGWNEQLQQYVVTGQTMLVSALRQRATQLAGLVLDKNGSGTSLSEKLSFMPFFSKQSDDSSSTTTLSSARTSSRASLSVSSSALSRNIYSSVVSADTSSSVISIPPKPFFGFGGANSSSVSTASSASSVATVKPKKLTKSGPESAAVIVATLLGLYCCVLHQRAKARI